jgi:hypothetical protein
MAGAGGTVHVVPNWKEPDMSTHAVGTFAMKSWDEKPIHEMDNAPKLTHTNVVYAYTGEITGDGTAEDLIVYNDDTHAGFVGLERVVGRIGERSGSFVLQHSGTYEGTLAKWSVTVVPGSGTGDLRGLRGHGEMTARHGDENHPYTLELDFE